MDHSHHMEHRHMPDMDHGAMCSMNVRLQRPPLYCRTAD